MPALISLHRSWSIVLPREQLSQERGPWVWDPLGRHLWAGYLPWTIKRMGKGMLEVFLANKISFFSHAMSSKSPWDVCGSTLLHSEDVGPWSPLVSGARDSLGVTKAIALPGINFHFDPMCLAEDSD